MNTEKVHSATAGSFFCNKEDVNKQLCRGCRVFLRISEIREKAFCLTSILLAGCAIKVIKQSSAIMTED